MRWEERRFKGEGDPETINDNNREYYSTKCFNIFICSTPLPKGIKLIEGIVKFQRAAGPSNLA
jgi:hypothetical protein